MSSEDCDVICLEIPEGQWGPSRDFTLEVDEINRQLRRAGIIPEGASVGAVKQTFLPRVYPLYTRGWLSRWQAALRTVAAMNTVYPIGRQGLYLHCNIDHCVHIADECVRHLTEGGTAPAWIDSVDRFLELRVRD